MPELAERLEDLGATSRTRMRRLHLHQEVYLKNRLLLAEKLAEMYPFLRPDYRRELQDIADKDVEMLKELGEIMTLVGQDTIDFMQEIRKCLKS